MSPAGVPTSGAGVGAPLLQLRQAPAFASAPQLCLGPLNEPVDIILCNKSVVLLRALEEEGAAPGSILMVDIQPPEDSGVLFYHGAAQDVLYTRPWRRLYVGAPCTHTANSGAGAPVLGGARRWWYIWCEVRAHAAVRTTGVGRRSRRALVRADAAP